VLLTEPAAPGGGESRGPVRAAGAKFGRPLLDGANPAHAVLDGGTLKA
jgi:hypothetical protein